MANYRFAVRVTVNGAVDLGGGNKTREELQEAAEELVRGRLEDYPPCQVASVEVEVVDVTEYG